MAQRPSMPGSDVFGLSDTLWGDLPLDIILAQRDRNFGWGVFDDFSTYGSSGAMETSLGHFVSEGNQYRTFEYKGAAAQMIIPDTTGYYTVPTGFPILSPLGQTLQAAATIIPTPGQLTFTPAAASDQGQIQMGGSTATLNSLPFTPYPKTSMVPMSVYFECRIKLSALATGATTFFVGLAGVGAGITAVPCATTTISTVPGVLGFGCLSGDDANVIGLVYGKAGQAINHYKVSSQAGLKLLTLLGTTADVTKGYLNIGNTCYFKLGFKYNGVAKTLTPYINGVPQDGISGPNKIVGSGLLSANLGAAAGGTGSSTLWPAAPMTPTAGLWQTGSGPYQTLTLDWWGAVQSFVT